MPRLSTPDKEQIRALSRKELEDIVIKLASEKGNYNYLEVNYLNKENGSRELF